MQNMFLVDFNVEEKKNSSLWGDDVVSAPVSDYEIVCVRSHNCLM